MPLSRRLLIVSAAASVAGAIVAGGRAAPGAEADGADVPEALVMFRRAGCPWCHAWDREVGPAYPKTAIGRALPLRKVDLDAEGDGGYALARPVRYTPTFVLVAEGRERARIEGYPGDEFFWVRLEQLAAESGVRVEDATERDQPEASS